MNNIYCVRADFGRYTQDFINGGYIAIGWLPDCDLGYITHREELYSLYKDTYPNDTSNVVVGVQVGQISRFLLDIQEGDFVITPSADTNYLYYGVVEANGYYYAPQNTGDNCYYRHRRKIKWVDTPILRSEFSVPFQNTMRSSLTVFAVNHKNNFFEAIGRSDLIPRAEQIVIQDYYKTVINRILELDAMEFEILVKHILPALGFEGAEHTGRTGDGGVDVKGILDVSGLARIMLFVQAKRYKLGSKISANVVKQLRSSIPQGAQGAFITTADFHHKAKEIANEVGFARIGLINGEQLVDILTEHWEDIPQDFKEKLNLKLGLITG